LGEESPIIEGLPVNSNCVTRFADVPPPTDTFCFFSETFTLSFVLNVVSDIYGAVVTPWRWGEEEVCREMTH